MLVEVGAADDLARSLVGERTAFAPGVARFCLGGRRQRWRGRSTWRTVRVPGRAHERARSRETCCVLTGALPLLLPPLMIAMTLGGRSARIVRGAHRNHRDARRFSTFSARGAVRTEGEHSSASTATGGRGGARWSAAWRAVLRMDLRVGLTRHRVTVRRAGVHLRDQRLRRAGLRLVSVGPKFNVYADEIFAERGRSSSETARQARRRRALPLDRCWRSAALVPSLALQAESGALAS